MFVDWKNQHCENDYTTQSNLQIQCNPYQTTNGILHRSRTKSFKICLETQKTPNSQSNLEKENQSWRNQAPRLQTILQSYSNQDGMIVAQKNKVTEVTCLEYLSLQQVNDCLYVRFVLQYADMNVFLN